MSCNDINVSNNFILIDPNCEILSTQPWFNKVSDTSLGIPKFEEIRSFVELSMIPRNPNYVLIQGNSTTTNSKKLNGPIVLQGFKTRNGKSFYSTDYTDELMGGDETNYEGFGIKNLEVSFDANKVPLVSVTFYDLRGNVLNNFNSKFALMFQLPYPIFNLKIKGGFGPTVEYRLLKTRDDISVDDSGNYIITSKFIGDRFAPLSDVPLLYLMAVPYLNNATVDILDTSINSFHELIVASKRLFEKVELVKNSDQVKEQEAEVKKLTDLITALELVKTELNDINKVKEKFSEDSQIKSLSSSTFTDFVNNFIVIDKDKSVNFGVPSVTNPGEFFNNFNRVVNAMVALYNKNINDIDATVGNLVTTSNKLYTLASGTDTQRIERINFKDLTDRIVLEKTKLEALASSAANKLTTELTNLPKNYLGQTDLTILSIFRAIFKDYNILLQKIKEAGDAGYTDQKNGKRTQQKFDRMGFPTVIKQDSNGANKLIYPGTEPEFKEWPEVKLIEDFITAYAKAAKASALADLLSETNNDGVSKYAPINPREIYEIDSTNTAGNQVSPDNIYFSKQLDELCKLIYERFLILTNVNLNMISTLSTDYNSWNIDPDEGAGVKTWVKNCFFDLKDLNEIKKGAFNFAISMEARNIAFAISTNQLIKDYFKQLAVNFNKTYFNGTPNDSIVKAVKETDVSGNKLPLTQVGAFDDKFITAGVAQPQLRSAGGPETDIISTFLTSISPDSDKPFEFTKKNVIYIKDSKFGSTRQAVFDAQTYGDILGKSAKQSFPGASITISVGLTIYEFLVDATESVANLFDSDGNAVNLSSINDTVVPSQTYNIKQSDYDTDSDRWLSYGIAKTIGLTKTYPSLKDQIEDKNTIYELYNTSDNDLVNKSVFNFELLHERLNSPCLVQIPRGMLIIMGSVLRTKVDNNLINSNGYYELELSSEKFYIKNNSKFYNFLLYEADTFNTVYGWKPYLKNGNYYNSRLYDPSTKKYKQTLEATLEYLYQTAYISVNDYRFTSDPTNSSRVITKGPSDNGLYIKYLESLIKKVDEFVKKDQEQLDAKLSQIDSHIKDPDVKLATYKSFQVIYENFLHGTDNYKLVVSNGDDSSFKFVDRAYNPIGDECILDLKTLLNDVNDTDVSLLSAISRLLSDNNFWFYPFQGWLSDSDKYEELFRIQYDNPRTTKPVFVAMYVGGLSSNPGNTGNLDDFPIKDDSIKKNDIPGDFKNKGGNLHAFKVKFTGTQNQMVFSNLQVSTESLKNTDEGLRIQSDIINNASNSFSIPKGQSLLNVYQKQSYTSTIKIPFGNMGIQPTQYYYQEYMPLFDGLYIIYSVSHSIDSDTQRLETTFKGYRLKRDVNPIVKQLFVDFINNNFFTNTLDNFNITSNASCGKATPSTVDTVYPRSVKWQRGTQPVIVQLTNPPTYKVILMSLAPVSFITTRFSAEDVIKAAERVIDKIAPTTSAANKKRVITATLAIAIKEQGLKGFNYNLSGVEASGFNVFSASDVNGRVQATEGGTGKKKWYYSFTSLDSGLVPSISSIMSRNMFGQNDEPNEFAWRWYRDWNGYGGRTTEDYIAGKRTDCDIIRGAELVYIRAMKDVNRYSKYASATSLAIPSVSTLSTGVGTTPIAGGTGSKGASGGGPPVDVTTTLQTLTIGDSISVNTSKLGVPKITTPVLLTDGGQASAWMIRQLKQVKNPLTSVKKVVLSMGANDRFELTSLQTDLANEISRVFPSATKYILNGHFGWGGISVTTNRTESYWKSTINTYIGFFKGKGYVVLGDVLGPISHPGGNDKFMTAVLRDLKSNGVV